MIALTTFSLLTACLRPADGSSASPSSGSQAVNPAAGVAGSGLPVELPRQAGPWARTGTPRLVTEKTIFDYMDGAGELYLAYRFDHLDVYEYSAPDKSLGAITVELYWMKSADDAFGLLSTDWGGEAIVLREPIGDRSGTASGPTTRPAADTYPAVPSHTALYGGGLLRFWSGNLYGRVMATRESPRARAQVLALALLIVGSRPGGDHPPEILSKIPARLSGGLALRPDRTCFFRSHLVLNSMYYVAPGDILGLGPAVDAATTEYRPEAPGARPVRLVQARYPSARAAALALKSFLGSYVSSPGVPAAARSGAGRAQAEGGWAGWAARDRWLAIVLDAPDRNAAEDLATAALAALAPE
jgi:hypothetical protein